MSFTDMGSMMHDPSAAGTTDPNFDNFIDSDLILDAGTPVSTPSTPVLKKDSKSRPKPLSSLRSRLSSANMDRQIPSSPGAANEFLTYTHASGSSVTTPTTSGSSALNTLNFDFFDAGDGTENGNNAEDDGVSSADPSVNGAMSSPHANLSGLTTPSATHFGGVQNSGLPAAAAPNPLLNVFDGVDPTNATLATPLAAPMNPFQRSVDDMGHQLGHPMNHHPAHHQRSLSLREVAPAPMLHPFMPGNAAMSSFSFNPNLKFEQDGIPSGVYVPEMPSPSTLGWQSPTSSSAVSSSIFDHQSPRQEKKRRLTNAGKKDEEGKPRAKKGAASSKANGKGNDSTKKSSVQSRKSQSGSATSAKAGKPASSQSTRPAFNSLIENTPMPMSGMPAPIAPTASSAMIEDTTSQPMARSTSNISNATSDVDGGAAPSGFDGKTSSKKKGANKRPPPSASQITESGMPFPVIDTSAKHSSLFVPPDMSGLTKREERLVKNRAAAFLSRQRKREQFEELESKCKSLSRLVWRLWEEAQTHVNSRAKSPFAERAIFSQLMMEQEGVDVQNVFDDVLMLKGGSIAPMEDGQLQGAVAAGIKSANGRVTDEREAASVSHRPMNLHSQSSAQLEDASREIARLRYELDMGRQREADMQAELASERALRLKNEFEAEQRERAMRPFRAGGSSDDVSLTVAARPDDEDEDEEEVNAKTGIVKEEGGQKRRASRGAGNSRPSRTSQRLQRQQSSSALTHGNSPTNGSQRKATSAALMMVLFSFALFGLPNGDIGSGLAGGAGISSAQGAATHQFPLGRVLGAPFVDPGFNGEDDEDDIELGHHLPPSSHLSADDLLPLSNSLHVNDRQEEERGSKASLTQSLRDIISQGRGAHADEAGDFTMDYSAFARDLGNSLDWDMKGGFIVLGSGNEEEEEEQGRPDEKNRAKSEQHDEPTNGQADADKLKRQRGNSEVKEAPTKLTLFVPAPSEVPTANGEADGVEDRFYDAPLISEAEAASGTGNGQKSADHRDLTQAEATRAALQILRNHRVAREAAALAASRRLNTGPPSAVSGATAMGNARARMDAQTSMSPRTAAEDEDQEMDFLDEPSSSDKMDHEESGGEEGATTSAADRIRGTDFYQLEFSLSGAKVRNVAELARLFSSMRHKMVE